MNVLAGARDLPERLERMTRRKPNNARLNAGIAAAFIGTAAMMGWGALTLSSASAGPDRNQGNWSGTTEATPSGPLTIATLGVPRGGRLVNGK